MPEPVRYHFGEQYAVALLHPILASIRDLEDRAHHYVEHLRLSPDDEEAVRRAWEVLAGARQEIERLRLESRDSSEPA